MSDAASRWILNPRDFNPVTGDFVLPNNNNNDNSDNNDSNDSSSDDNDNDNDNSSSNKQ